MLLKDKYELGDLKTNNLTLKKHTLLDFPGTKNNFVGFNNYVGIEVEVENIRGDYADPYLPNFSQFWNQTKDGSLRGSGVELVSVPLRGINISGALHYLNHYLTSVQPQHKFSHRCGIHVHINCRNYTLDQVNNIINTYLCLETVLFDQFVQKDRSGNSFCMPVIDVFAGRKYGHCKYQALNRKSLSTLGTLEFRHLQGTSDMVYIKRWIKILTNMVTYATSKTTDELNTLIMGLNTFSNYIQFTNDALGPNNFVKLQEAMERDIYITKASLHRDFT